MDEHIHKINLALSIYSDFLVAHANIIGSVSNFKAVNCTKYNKMM